MYTRSEGIDIAVINQLLYTQEESKREHDFICIRAVEGNRFDQTRWIIKPTLTYYDLLPTIKDVPVRGAYHRTLDPRGGIGWKEQAKAMTQAIQDAGSNFYHFWWVDVEPAREMTVEWVKASWLIREEVQQATGVPGFFYINKSMWYYCWQNPTLRWMAKEDLAYAQYPYRTWNPNILNAQTDPVTWQPSIPKIHFDEGGTWSWWQCSADENGAVKFARENGIMDWRASKAVDWDLYNGTTEDLFKRFGVGDAPEPVDPPSPLPEEPCEDCVPQAKVDEFIDEAVNLLEKGKKLAK